LRSTIELIVTDHAIDRLNDLRPLRGSPRLPLAEDVRVLQFRRTDTKNMCGCAQIEGGFLVGLLRSTRKGQMLICADGNSAGRCSANLCLFALRATGSLVDKITFQRENTEVIRLRRECKGRGPRTSIPKTATTGSGYGMPRCIQRRNSGCPV